jgi:FkbH-like protein
MSKAVPTVEIISDFNAELLRRYLENDERAPSCSAQCREFGEVYPALLDESGEKVDFGIVWTTPAGVVPAFVKALTLQPVDHEAVLEEVRAFARALLRYAERARFVLVPAWSVPLAQRGYGMLDWRPGLGLHHLVARMNLTLAESLAKLPTVFLLEPGAWLQAAGPSAASPRMWLAGKVPYGNRVFQEAVVDIKAAMSGALGSARKLIVLDLDDTLWGGVIGETGWEGIRLGGHDPIGEAYVAFQGALKALANRGVQIAVVSKNDEPVALEAFDKHPEMRLRRADLAGWRINWQDKAQNIAQLVAELNLGLDAVVFVDDNPVERGRIREELPAVLVPDWPEDPTLFASRLTSLACFDTAAVSEEDRARGRMYADERERRQAQAQVGSMEEWLRGLDIEVRVDELRRADLARAAQLFNKTNQLNLSTRRLSESELMEWAAAPHRKLWTVRVKDRFGELGLTGVVSVETDGASARIVDFILSCRAMGRCAEETMLHVASSHAAGAGARELSLTYVPTARNAPCLRFLESSGLTRTAEREFRWSGAAFPLPDAVTLVGPAAQERNVHLAEVAE